MGHNPPGLKPWSNKHLPICEALGLKDEHGPQGDLCSKVNRAVLGHRLRRTLHPKRIHRGTGAAAKREADGQEEDDADDGEEGRR